MKNFGKRIIGAAALALATAPNSWANEIARPDPLNQMRAEHVMISTDDFDETVAWYSQKLGFKIIHQWTVPELPGLKLGYIERNGFVIEIVETPDETEKKTRPVDLAEALKDRGFGHLAFLVADVDAVAAELKARKVDFLVEPTSFPDSGRRLIFVFDNNNNIIEFLTPLDAYGSGGSK